MICNLRCKHVHTTLVQMPAAYYTEMLLDAEDDFDRAGWALLLENAPILTYQCDMCGALLPAIDTPPIEELNAPVPVFDRKAAGYRLWAQCEALADMIMAP